jgi:hypothetical protein
MKPAHWSGIAAVLLVLSPVTTLAQESGTAEPTSSEPEPRWQLGVGVPGSFVVGDASDFLSDGIGILGFGGRRATGPLWIRADVSYTWLRGESFQGERADDALLSLGIGPEFDVGGRVLRFYLRGSGGLIANFQSRRGSNLPEETSWAGYFGGGIGFRIRFAQGAHPVALDLGGDIFKTGKLVLATLSEAGGTSEQALGMITLRAGLTFGLP